MDLAEEGTPRSNRLVWKCVGGRRKGKKRSKIAHGCKVVHVRVMKKGGLFFNREFFFFFSFPFSFFFLFISSNFFEYRKKKEVEKREKKGTNVTFLEEKFLLGKRKERGKNEIASDVGEAGPPRTGSKGGEHHEQDKPVGRFEFGIKGKGNPEISSRGICRGVYIARLGRNQTNWEISRR